MNLLPYFNLMADDIVRNVPAIIQVLNGATDHDIEISTLCMHFSLVPRLPDVLRHGVEKYLGTRLIIIISKTLHPCVYFVK